MTVAVLTYINSALTRTGFERISECPGDTAEGAVADENYENLVRAKLASHPWKWATTERQLSHLSDEPNLPWLHAYQRPTDLLDLRTVKVEGYTVDYELVGQYILCNQDEDQVVIAKFLWRPPEEYWPAWFAEAITQELEALFLRSPAKNFAEAEKRAESAERSWTIAKSRDAKLKTPSSPESSPTLAARGANPAARSTLEARRA